MAHVGATAGEKRDGASNKRQQAGRPLGDEVEVPARERERE